MSQLKSSKRPCAAQEVLDNAASGKEPKQGLVNLRAFELAKSFFSIGSLELSRAVLDKFLSLRDVRQLLPEAVQKTRQEATDAKVADEMLDTAKQFLQSS